MCSGVAARLELKPNAKGKGMFSWEGEGLPERALFYAEAALLHCIAMKGGPLTHREAILAIFRALRQWENQRHEHA